EQLAAAAEVVDQRTHPARPTVPADPRLDSLEVLFNLSTRQAQHDRPTVRTDGRIGSCTQLLQNVRHLLIAEWVISLYSRVTCCSRRNALHRRLQVGATIESFEIVSQRQQSPGALADLDQRRYGGDLDRPSAEAFEFVAEPLELGRATNKR